MTEPTQVLGDDATSGIAKAHPAQGPGRAKCRRKLVENDARSVPRAPGLGARARRCVDGVQILPHTFPLRPHDRGDAGRASSRAADGRRRPGAPVPKRRTADERELVAGGPRVGVGAAPAGRSGRGAARRDGSKASWSWLTILLVGDYSLPLLRLRSRRLEEPQDRPRRRPERRDALGVGHPGLDAFAAHRDVPI